MHTLSKQTKSVKKPNTMHAMPPNSYVHVYGGGGLSVLSAYIYKEMVFFFYYTVSRKRTDQMHANYTLYVMKLA